MQPLEVISVNIWHILISLLNLLILFLIIKKFLYKPVKDVLDKRQATVDADYDAASKARLAAEADRDAYSERLAGADSEANEILRRAKENAERKSNQIVAGAEEKAAGLMRRASEEIELEKRKAIHDLKGDIVDISIELSKKVLEREVNEADHREMIDQFIEGIGETDD